MTGRLFVVYFSSLTYCFSDYYSVCAISGQHYGHLPFRLPGFVELILLLLHVLLKFAVAEIYTVYCSRNRLADQTFYGIARVAV